MATYNSRISWTAVEIIVAAIVLISVAGLARYFMIERASWKGEVSMYATAAGCNLALANIHDGKVYLLDVTSGEVDATRTIRNEGRFEVRAWPTGNSLQEIYGAYAFVKAYNSTIKAKVQ